MPENRTVFRRSPSADERLEGEERVRRCQLDKQAPTPLEQGQHSQRHQSRSVRKGVAEIRRHQQSVERDHVSTIAAPPPETHRECEDRRGQHEIEESHEQHVAVRERCAEKRGWIGRLLE